VGFWPNHERSSPLTVNFSVQSAIHSVLTTRVILNIREAASQRLDDFSFDLHLSGSDSQVSRLRISFTENPAVHYSDVGHEGEVSRSRGRFGSVGTTRTGMVSTSNSTAPSHITLPMTRDAKGKRVVGRSQSDHDNDDGEDSIHASPDEWV